MRDDITLKQLREAEAELESVFSSMIDRERLKEAYATFRSKTGCKVLTFHMDVMDVHMPQDRYYGQTSLIGAASIKYEKNI